MTVPRTAEPERAKDNSPPDSSVGLVRRERDESRQGRQKRRWATGSIAPPGLEMNPALKRFALPTSRLGLFEKL